MSVTVVQITSDEEKVRSCPDATELSGVIERWRPHRGMSVRVHLPPLKVEQIPGLISNCESWMWKVFTEDRDRIRPNDHYEGRWLCEHFLDID